MEEKDIFLETSGMGFIIYADFAVKKIKRGENFLSEHYWKPEDVAKEVNSGGIVGVCTGAPGKYRLSIREGIPCDELWENSILRRRLSIKVTGGKIYFRDLYELMDWDERCDESQTIKIEDGYYTMLLMGNMPNDGSFGENQVIYLYIYKNDTFCEPQYKGVPDFTQCRKREELSNF